MRRNDNARYRRLFHDWLVRWNEIERRAPADSVVAYEVYWVVRPTRPAGPRARLETRKERLFDWSSESKAPPGPFPSLPLTHGAGPCCEARDDGARSGSASCLAHGVHCTVSMANDRSSRRDFLRSTLAASALLPAAALLGCGKKLAVCNTPEQLVSLSESDRTMRNGVKYVDAAPDAAKNCANCLQFQPAAPDACGGCKVVKGPIHPKGWCTIWVQKPALDSALALSTKRSARGAANNSQAGRARRNPCSGWCRSCAFRSRNSAQREESRRVTCVAFGKGLAPER